VALSNKERIGRMLDALAAGLRPVIEREFAVAYGERWISTVAAQPGFTGRADADDPQFLLNAIWFHWAETLGRVLGPAERSYVAELRGTRNRWAHGTEGPFSGEDLYRAYDTAERLLRAVSAPQAEDMAKARSQAGLENALAAQKQRKQTGAQAPTAGQPTAGLMPWRSVATPHRDVQAGRYRQAEFAADLSAVARADPGLSLEYGDPREFFSRTYLTDGLRLLLVGALKRLTDTGGESVVDLQTTFGGGKTHSMLALWHLADPSVQATALPDLEPVLEKAGVSALPPVSRVAIVGTTLSPITPRIVEGAEIRTLWGELAWQLGGAKAFASLAKSDRKAVPPGADTLRDLLNAHAPLVILIDEWVTYARLQWGQEDLPGGSFDAALSFAQQLTAAVDQVPGAMLVVSLPSSAIEVGGEGGQRALESLKHVIHRMDAPWRPAAAQEGFEIVRRRLFEPLAAESVRHRDEVVQRFSELYAQHAGSFPSESKEKAYLERLKGCYPVHPELFDRLFEDWSTLERFQRTRGVLKLMAAVIQALWERQDGSLLIMPSAVPLDDSSVLSQLTQYLEDTWTPIIESDVDGADSLPRRLDGENPTYGRYSAARRVARTVFLGSAPLPAAANKGIDDKRILLGAVQPGEAPATFGDALHKLAGTATFLYENQGRYWYSTQPSVNQLARDRADQQGTDRVEMEIERRVRLAAVDRGPFARVHVAPRTGSDVPDEDEVALVVLAPGVSHDAKSVDSPAGAKAFEILGSRGASARTNQNMLAFLAADATRLAELEQAARHYLAWSSIFDDGEAGRLNLDAFGRGQAKSQRDSADQAAAVRIGETYQWLLVPEQTDPLAKVTLRPVKVSGSDPLAVRAGAKLRNEELLITKFGGVNLRHVLNTLLAGQWNEHHYVRLRELWEWFAKYPYLPRLRDSSVLEGAIGDGAANLLWRSETFAYGAVREESGEYRGVVAGRQGETPITSNSVAVDGSVLPDPLPGEDRPLPLPPPPPPDGRIRRFEGEVTLAEPGRPLPELTKIVDEVIARLAQDPDVELDLTLHITATHDRDGFSDDMVRTITENARQLKMRSEWEKD
jgi:predicted AAA+ superfamily ATPase